MGFLYKTGIIQMPTNMFLYKIGMILLVNYPCVYENISPGTRALVPRTYEEWGGCTHMYAI